MVSNASDDLPEPESPVKTTNSSLGMSRLTHFRLCSLAPRILMYFFLFCHNLCSSKLLPDVISFYRISLSVFFSIISLSLYSAAASKLSSAAAFSSSSLYPQYASQALFYSLTPDPCQEQSHLPLPSLR